MNSALQNFILTLRNPIKFRLFLLKSLPSAYFSGVRIESFTEEQCVVSIPYKWFSKNPFRSTYFACLAMAAEMSTGALAMAHVHKRKPAVSMLVTGLEAEYFKKATSVTRFTCLEGGRFREAIEKAVTTGEAQVIKAPSVGRNEQGENIATFHITWSFKVKSNIQSTRSI